MAKKVIGVLLLFLLIIAGLVIYQWISYKNEKETEGRIQTHLPIYEISIDHTGNRLFINQKISGLEQDQFYVYLPKGAQNTICKTEADEECVIEPIEEGLELQVGNQREVTFTYEYALKDNEISKWLSKWHVQLLKDNRKPYAANYMVSLTEEVDKTITWVAGALNRADVEKKHLHYYGWEKKEATELPLYMTEIPLEKFTKNNVTYYNSEPNDELLKGKWKAILPENHTMTIVRTVEERDYLTPMLVVVREKASASYVEEQLVTSMLHTIKPPVNEEQQWLWNVLAAVVLNRPVGEKKVREMSEDLLNSISTETKNEFLKWILKSANTDVPVSEIDQALSKASNKQTNFFEKNSVYKDPAIPLYFIDDRIIYFEDEQINDSWQAIYRSEMLLLPLQKTAEKLNFEVVEMKQDPAGTILIKKNGNTWRFFLNENYFIYNQEDYGLTAMPLEKIGDEIYMSERWLEELLKIEVIKRNDGIYLRG